MPASRAVIATVLLGSVACGGGQDRRDRSGWDTFECNDRKASYFVVGSLAADEVGVTVECARGPRVTRWTQERDGARTEDSRAISPKEFEEVWVAIEGTGWRNLEDCPPESGAYVPVYSFEVVRGDDRGAFQCDALRPPFPWVSLVDELDQLAARIPGESGKSDLVLDDVEEPR